jgi:hypothetical protein
VDSAAVSAANRHAEKGCKLTAEEIYNVNNSSLKDAIVSFGGFCTAEAVSADGLLLTNHHCGFGSIQNHSSVDHDYLTNGFWAYSRDQELPNEGLTATFLSHRRRNRQHLKPSATP